MHIYMNHKLVTLRKNYFLVVNLNFYELYFLKVWVH